VLLVEDDGQVRDVALAILRRHGYLVIAACDGDEASQSCQAHPIHLLLTDLVMPGITGCELAHRLRGIRPELKVLCMSGYDSVATDADPDILELATAVRRVLDTDAPSTRR
jgi:two-component system cell cycle sensor histidine kinase/response regulator CckA